MRASVFEFRIPHSPLRIRLGGRALAPLPPRVNRANASDRELTAFFSPSVTGRTRTNPDEPGRKWIFEPFASAKPDQPVIRQLSRLWLSAFSL